MITPSRLICLRHGESANVVVGAAGALPNAPLTAHGRDQASAAAAALLDGDNAVQSTWRPMLLPSERPVAVYASDARRARETAEIIATAHGLRPTIVADLAEVDIGELEGATDAPTRARTAEVLRSWVVDGDLDQRVANGEDGHTVVDRMTRSLTTIADAHAGATAVVVGHVASLTAALATICHLGTEIWGAPLPYAVPFLVERTPDGWQCSWPGLPVVTGRR